MLLCVHVSLLYLSLPAMFLSLVIINDPHLCLITHLRACVYILHFHSFVTRSESVFPSTYSQWLCHFYFFLIFLYYLWVPQPAATSHLNAQHAFLEPWTSGRTPVLHQTRLNKCNKAVYGWSERDGFTNDLKSSLNNHQDLQWPLQSTDFVR